MYKLVFVLGLSFILGGCFWGTRMSSGGATSDVSSITIERPDKLPENYNGGGYSLCIERADHSDGGCSDSKFIENKWSASNVISYDLKNNCKSGYKLKMWLWKDDNSKKDESTVYVLKSSKGAEFKDGYAEIPKSKLTGGEIDLKFTFSKMNGTGGSITSNSGNTNVSIEVTVVDEDNAGSTTDDAKKTRANTGTSGSNYFVCNTKDTNSSGSSSGGDAGGAPKGDLDYIKSVSEAKSGYPSVVIQSSLRNCPRCVELKTQVLTPANLAKLKGKMYVYYIDEDKGYPYEDYCHIDTYGGSGIPYQVFFDKDKTKKDCYKGNDPARFKKNIKELSGVDL